MNPHNNTTSAAQGAGNLTPAKLNLTDLSKADMKARLLFHRIQGPNPHKWYTLSNGRAVEITDDLIAHSICPSDLNGMPCDFDEIGGCNKAHRLCEMMVKFQGHVCTGEGHCPFIHDIEMSCRYVADAHNRPNRLCVQTVWKNRLCVGGHDFERARQASKDAYFRHRQAARLRGSQGLIPYQKQW